MSTHKEELRRKISGERIRELRKELNLTQNQLSDIIGRERSEISKWERGIGTISTETYWRLYDAFRPLDVSMDYLMGVKDVRKPQNESIVRELHLSEQAIENIRYEGSIMGNNQRVWMLDLILSNRDAFTGLMDEMKKRCYPPRYLIDRHNIPETFLDPSSPNFIVIKAEHFKYFSKDSTENVYHRMKTIIEKFIDTVPDECICPNEWE